MMLPKHWTAQEVRTEVNQRVSQVARDARIQSLEREGKGFEAEL